MHDLLGATMHALTPGPTGEDESEEYQRALSAVNAMIRRRGWQLGEVTPTRSVAAEVLARLDRLGQQRLIDALDSYAEAAELIAKTDVALVAGIEGRDARAETALVGTVLGDVLIAALRRLAQEHMSSQQFRPPTV
jgi:hypothetical protein